jgi:hypothetical protein
VALTMHYVEQPRAKTQRSPFAAESSEGLLAPPFLRDPLPTRPGEPTPPPALRPASSVPQDPFEPLHRPLRPLIASLSRRLDACDVTPI